MPGRPLVQDSFTPQFGFAHLLQALADRLFQLPPRAAEAEEGLVWPFETGSSMCPERPGFEQTVIS